jgi:D-amino peptidase
MMEGMDASVDAVFFVGYHGSISGASSVLSHTYNPSVISKVSLNGTECGESGINALVALACRAPVALITGDRQTITEGGPFLKKAERVVVKESITRFAATQAHPLTARELIRDGAHEALRRLDVIPLPDIALPARLDVEVQTADMAQVASWVKGAERTGTRHVAIEGGDPLSVFRSFVALTYITRQAEGRLRQLAPVAHAADAAAVDRPQRDPEAHGRGDGEGDHDEPDHGVGEEQEQADDHPYYGGPPQLWCHDGSIHPGWDTR